MNLDHPRINKFCDDLRHRFDGTRVEELVRITFQFAYGAGYTDGVKADDMSKLMQETFDAKTKSVAEQYFPETKTCPKCGHKWGGA
jgi:hypothetical protein